MSEDEDKRVLTVQSHVVHGYVGNKAATFPLQLLGWEVDALNAVQFSNHTGYGSVHGYRLDDDSITDIYAGLKEQKFHYNALLTGYLPSASAVKAVGRIGADLKEHNLEFVWLLDPVMGDEGSMYVKPDVVPAYKAILKTHGLVTIVTPNYYEVELITGIKLKTKEDVLKALHVLHTVFAIPHVVISSLPHPSDPGKLLTVGSSAGAVGAGLDRHLERIGPVFAISQEKFDTYFTGTGDLFAALLLDNYFRLGPTKLADATVETVNTLRKVLKKTWKYSRKHNAAKVRMNNSAMRFHELRLVQNANLLKDHDEPGDVSWEAYA